MRWRLRVLGQASLEGAGRRVVPERKTSALLTFLAIEGATTRSRLAGLLWPDSGEERARGNLRQLLRRLRTSTCDQLLDAGDPVRLQADVDVDIIELQAAAVTRTSSCEEVLGGDLLAGHEYDDCPELLEWLNAQRERLLILRRELLTTQIERFAADEDYSGAVRLAERLIEADPLAEEPYRKAMKLHYLSGDRAAALGVFARCRDVLVRELGVEPLPETRDLAREIELEAPSLPDRTPRRRLPLAFERPPLLAGRAREWESLEDAWERGGTALVSGDPGMGKTRLAIDFAASRGKYMRMAARPGDQTIPYALFARAWRDPLSREADLLPDSWARAELALLLPELMPGGDPSSGRSTGGDKSLLLAAMYEQVRTFAAAGYDVLVVDDLQYADAASLEALWFLLGQPTPGRLRWLLCYRRGELDRATERRLLDLVREGGCLVELEPLSQGAVEEMLQGLSLTTSEGLAAPLARYTGGIPLFIVETLKSLAESGGLQRPFPKRLKPPRELSAVIEGRLARLSPGALRLARAAAVLEDSFDLEGAGKLLSADPLELADPLGELEGAGVLGEGGFSHELIRQAVLGGTPAAVRRLLHRRTALHLESLPVPPGLVARHFLAAGDDRWAAPYLKEAGDSAASAYRLDEAERLYRQSAELFEQQGQSDEAFAALNAASEILLKSEYGPKHDELERAMFRLARTPAQIATAWQTRSLFLQLLAKAEESEAAAREGHRYAVAAGDEALQMDLLNNLVGALWLQDRIGETLGILSQAIELGERLGDHLRLSEGLANMGVILDHLNRHREAIEFHRRAEALRAQHGDRISQVLVMGNLSVSQAELGLARESLATSRRMLMMLAEVKGVDNLVAHARLGAGAALRDLGEFQEAVDQLQEALAIAERLKVWMVGSVRRHLALTHAFLGRPQAARALLEVSLATPDTPVQFRGADLQALGVVLHLMGEDPGPPLLEAEALAGVGRPLRRGNLLLAKSRASRGEAALVAASEALSLARENELEGLVVAAACRCAAAYLSLGRVDEALAHSALAIGQARDFTAPDFYFGEVLLVRYRTLRAAGSRDVDTALRRAVEWVMAAALKLDSEELRATFLSDNPVNREILAEAGGNLAVAGAAAGT